MPDDLATTLTGADTTPAPAPVIDYSAEVARLKDLEAARMSANMPDADSEARRVRIMDQIGKPIPLEMTDTYEGMLNRDRLRETFKEKAFYTNSPNLYKFLFEDGNAALVQNDLDRTTFTWQQLEKLGKDAALLDGRDEKTVLMAAGHATRSVFETALLTAGALPALAQNALGSRPTWWDWLWDKKKSEAQAASTFRDTLPSEISSGVASSLASLSLGLTPALMFESLAARVTAASMGEAAVTAVSQTQDINQSNLDKGASAYLTPTQAALVAFNATATAMLEKFGGPVGEMAMFGGKKALAVGLLHNGVSEAVQETIDQATGSLATEGSVAVADLWKAGWQAGLIGTAMGVPFTLGARHQQAVQLMQDAKNVVESVHSHETLANAIEGMAQSKLMQLAPTRAEAMIQQAVKDSGTITFNATEFDEMAQKINKSPQDLAAMLKAKPDGAGVVVPMGKYIYEMSRAEPTTRQAFAEIAQIKGVSPKDINDQITRIAEQQKALLAEGPAKLEGFDSVVDDTPELEQEIAAELKNVRIPTKRGKGLGAQLPFGAALYANWARIQAIEINKAGGLNGKLITPKEAWDLHRVKVQGSSAVQQSADVPSAQTVTGPATAPASTPEVAPEVAPEVKQETHGSYSPEQNLIEMYPSSNNSTLVHESAHFFLHTFATIASDPNASAYHKEQLDAFNAWVNKNAEEVAAGYNARKLADAPAVTADEIRAEPFAARANTANQAAWVAKHEYFARGFEAWVAEGKAPVKGMRKLFAQFATFMANIYKGLSLDVTLDDNARLMYRRLLATDAMMQEAEKVYDFGAHVAELNKVGLSEADVHKMLERQRTDLDELRADAIDMLAKDLTKKEKASRASYRDDMKRGLLTEEPKGVAMTAAEAMIDGNPEGYQTLIGKTLNAKDAEDKLPKSQVDWLAKKGLLSKDGLTLDQFQESIGELPYRDVLTAMTEMKDPVKEGRVWLAAELDQMEMQQFGSMFNEEQAQAMVKEVDEDAIMQRMAEDVAKAFNITIRRMKGVMSMTDEERKAREQELKDEVAAARKRGQERVEWFHAQATQKGKDNLEAATDEFKRKLREAEVQANWDVAAANKKLDDYKAAQQQAEELRDKKNALREMDPEIYKGAVRAAVWETPPSAFNPDKWRQVANNAAKSFRQALKQKDLIAAQAFKIDEITARERAKIEEVLGRKFVKATELLARMGDPNSKERKTLSANPTYDAYANSLVTAFAGMPAPDASAQWDALTTKPLLNHAIFQSLTSLTGSVDKRTARDWAEFQAAIESVVETSVIDNKTFVKGLNADRAIATQAITEEILANPDKTVYQPGTAMDTAYSWAMLSLKLDTAMKILSGGKPGGIDNMYRGIHDANNTWVEIQGAASKELQDFVDKELNKEHYGWDRMVEVVPGVRMTGWNMILAAAQYGSESGRGRILQHLESTYRLNGNVEANRVMEAMFAKMTPAQVKMLEKMYAMNEAQFVKIVAQHHEMRTQPPVRIEPMPFKIGDKTISGGYMPLRYAGMNFTGQDLADSMQRGMFTVGVTGEKSFEKERQAAINGQLDLSFDVFMDHIAHTNRVLAFRPTALDVTRILRDTKAQAAIERAHGVAFNNHLQTLIDGAFVGAVPPTDVLSKGALRLARTTTQAILAYNAKSAGKQVFGAANAIAETGARYFAAAVAEFAKAPAEATKRARAESAYMRDRTGLTDPSMHDIKELTTSRLRALGRHSFIFIKFVQSQIDTMTYMAAKAKSQAANPGKSEEFHIQTAEMAVSRSQGGSTDLDRTVGHHKSVPIRLIVSFGSPGMTLFNQIYGAYKEKDAKKLGAVAFWTIGVGVALEVALRALQGAVPEDDDKKGWAKFLAGMFASQILSMNALGRLAEPKLTADKNWTPMALNMPERTMTGAKAAWDSVGDIMDGKDPEQNIEQSARNLTQAAMMFYGLPSSQTTRVYDSIMAMRDAGVSWSAIRIAVLGKPPPGGY